MDVFHRNIPIKQLKILIQPENAMEIGIECEKSAIIGEVKREKADIDHVAWITLSESEVGQKKREYNFGLFMKDNENLQDLKPAILATLINFIMKNEDAIDNCLYLPSSRTGMLLLYKYFFSERDKMQNAILKSDGGSFRNELGLTAPVYDFLQRLLRYMPNEANTTKNADLLRFIEQNMIDGKVALEGNELVYRPNHSNEAVPLYLSSSMINELTPIVEAITGIVDYSFIMYDEIENCLHPQKQQEMARLLNRMNNAGYRLIVSTHSDTMASKMNNLFLLSFSYDNADKKRKKLKELHLEEADLLNHKEVKVYQFTNGLDGMSTVSELEFQTVPYVGYDFSLFTDNSIKLYEEAKVIIGDN